MDLRSFKKGRKGFLQQDAREKKPNETYVFKL